MLFSQSPSSLNTTPSVLASGGFAQNRNTHNRNTHNRNTHNRHAQNRHAQYALDAHNARIEMYKSKNAQNIVVMHLPGVLGALMQTRRDVIPNRPRIEEAIVNAQSQLPILLERKHDRRRRGRDTMAKKFRHPTRLASAVAAQYDDAQLKGRADERWAPCPPVTAV